MMIQRRFQNCLIVESCLKITLIVKEFLNIMQKNKRISQAIQQSHYRYMPKFRFRLQIVYRYQYIKRILCQPIPINFRLIIPKIYFCCLSQASLLYFCDTDTQGTTHTVYQAEHLLERYVNELKTLRVVPEHLYYS